jgi:geranylgeranyl pyrophosphate synthase
MDTGEIAKILDLPKLPRLLEKVEDHLQAILAAADPMIGRPARRVLDSGGKRLRPILLIASANIRGGVNNKKMISGAAAIELIHMGSLVHDDIIDGHTSRRGVPTLNSKEGLNTALLVGDWLFSRGLAEAAAVSLQSVSEAALAVCSMCEGQALELTKGYQTNARDSAYLYVAQKKSGALIAAACRLGAINAGLAPADIEALGSYGQSFGIAFQIIDDIADNDFKQKSIHQAAAEAKAYIGRAVKALKPFETESSSTGLDILAETYLKSVLGDNGLLRS